MEVAPGDLFDRLSIIQLKSERLDPELVREELDDLSQAFDETRDDYPILTIRCEDMVELLRIVNGQIWDLEGDIRQGKEGVLGLEEVGRRAITIRNLNGIRVWVKNLIARSTGKGNVEHKKDHASAISGRDTQVLLKQIHFPAKK